MRKMDTELEVKLIPSQDIENTVNPEYDFDKIIFELDNKLDLLSSQADVVDYLISIGSGVLCGLLDIFWTGEFDLQRGREFGSDTIDTFVKRTAKLLGCKDDDLKNCVKFLEDKFPIPSDGNTSDFGGGLQHHLRDFAHHPTIIGLMFSLLTQFTYKAYGTDTKGTFIVVDVQESSRAFIGKDTAEKIIYGTIIWFFHLVSDMAGSKSTAGISGGTGIPGPILSMAKELSVLPFFKDIRAQDKSLSKFISKIFNGTLFAQYDEKGKMLKETVVRFDLRGELGMMSELGRQAIPVIANECFVRTFYFIRRLAVELRDEKVNFEKSTIDWKKVRPFNSPTLTRMLTIATGVFTSLDAADAVVTQQYFVGVNYIGVGRFAVALENEAVWALKRRNIGKIKEMYNDLKRFTYTHTDQTVYERMQRDMDTDKFGLTEEQTEILYNLEYYKVLNDISSTKLPIGSESIIELKKEWLQEWKTYMSNGYASFLQSENAVLNWYEREELMKRIEKNNPSETWFRLVLLEAMLFEPYYPLSLEKDKKGNEIPSKKYKNINTPLAGYKKSEGDRYLEQQFSCRYCSAGYIKRIRKCYDKVLRELNEVLKTALTSIAITAGVTIATVATAGAFAPTIAVALVGSNFAGLSGAALTSACLAYLGGGAIAAGGLGMAGGTMAIVGGGAVLGLGVGAGVGGITGRISLMGKKNTILQSAKLLVAVREIFLNDEQDLAYSNSVYEQYVNNIRSIEKNLVDLKLKADTADSKEKKLLKTEIKNAEESVNAMKIAMKSMKKFISSFDFGMNS